MMKESKISLSDLEELILSVLSGQDNLYGLQISKTIEVGSAGKMQVGFGSLYPALRRLEGRKFVTSAWGESTPGDRGGARRRYYKITALGEEMLNEKQQIRESIASQRPVIA